MSAKKYKTIGILGGMGPEASATLYLRIIQIFQEKYNAKYDADFPEIILISLPIPDVVEKLDQEQEIEKMLVTAVQKLELAGTDFIVIPCNSTNYFLPKMQANVGIPILSTLEETAKLIGKSIEKVGIIGTTMTIQNDIYGPWLTSKIKLVPTESEQQTITSVIMNILAGKRISNDRLFLQQVITNLKNQGAQKIILGCTELPLLISGPDLIDSLEILAQVCVTKSMETEK